MPRLFALLLVLRGGVPHAAARLTTAASPAAATSPRRAAARDMRGQATRDLRSTPTSCCGVAGNPGNEDGVGKFCQAASDCTGQKANLCAVTFAPNLTFCTMACMTNGSATECGSGAQCQCASNQCACIPGECVMPPPGC